MTCFNGHKTPAFPVFFFVSFVFLLGTIPQRRKAHKGFLHVQPLYQKKLYFFVRKRPFSIKNVKIAVPECRFKDRRGISIPERHDETIGISAFNFLFFQKIFLSAD
jgi:hypothetical protein